MQRGNELIARYIDSEQYRVALNSTDSLLKELKQLDDKIILTEVYMLESRAAHAIQNMARAKVSRDRRNVFADN
jgi:26S proteasome regulatory subunit N6